MQVKQIQYDNQETMSSTTAYFLSPRGKVSKRTVLKIKGTGFVVMGSEKTDGEKQISAEEYEAQCAKARLSLENAMKSADQERRRKREELRERISGTKSVAAMRDLLLEILA